MFLEIAKVYSSADALDYLRRGYCPIECVFADEMVYDGLKMIHHGSFSYLESVGLRAYRDHFASRVRDPRFVVAGGADGDATFAIASLCGMLPRGLLPLAQLVHRVDTEPMNFSLLDVKEGGSVLWWRQNAPKRHDVAAFYEGVGRWVMVAEGLSCDALAHVKEKEEERIRKAEAAQVHRISGSVCFVESAIFAGFDVWYRTAPVIVLHWMVDAKGKAAVGCRGDDVAEELFGKGGLLNVCPQLEPTGWRGKTAIIGAGAGSDLNREQVYAAAKQVAACVIS